MGAKTVERNRKIFADYITGTTTQQLAQTYGLARPTIIAIVGVERHKLEVSADAFYEGLRSSGLHPWIKP
ncbi:MAG: hypothetical protein H0U98_11025 [Alphaproteobacteria bacterium]|nr:hypothetical protein [Alphaproteobacteria bacterium]